MRHIGNSNKGERSSPGVPRENLAENLRFEGGDRSQYFFLFPRFLGSKLVAKIGSSGLPCSLIRISGDPKGPLGSLSGILRDP